jgi:hypothetical protein
LMLGIGYRDALAADAEAQTTTGVELARPSG